jgi:glycerol-3-phosphate cytidylyltransferase
MKIGFTVGVWDIFHAGHYNILIQARKYCNYLVVGIMTDYWVKVQKGHDRPIEKLKIRIRKLKKSGLCDKIVVLDTLDMSHYLQICDIWIKGEQQNNMRPFKYKNIVRIKRIENISTTSIIKKK